jgi:MFS family permease
VHETARSAGSSETGARVHVLPLKMATPPPSAAAQNRGEGHETRSDVLILRRPDQAFLWYFTSLFLQNVLGYSALRAGLGQTPAAVTFAVVARWAAALLPRVGVRPLVLAGCGCFLAGFSWLAQAHTHSSYAASVLGPTLLIAIGIGLTFPTLMAAATADAPEGDAGTIGGLANTSSQVGGSVGLAALATAASARTAAGGSSPAAALAACSAGR